MSVHRHGDGWQVRWKDADGKQHGRTFPRKDDADTANREIKRRKRLGLELSNLFLDASAAPTLAEFAKTGLRTHTAMLNRKTREQYKWALHLHLVELLDVPLPMLDVPRLLEHQRHLLEHETNPRSVNTVRTALTILSSILTVAVAHGLIPANPVRSMRKVQADPKDEIVPLSPVQLERVIAALEGRSRIICVLGGQLGLSPIEIRLAPWINLLGDKLRIDAGKTKRQRARPRVIDIPRATAHELRTWRIESGRRGTDPIIGPMTAAALKAWSQRTLKPLVADIAGRDDASTYLLRHSHASALHYCGYTVPSAAKRLGHGRALHLEHYSHVIDALEDHAKFKDLDALIQWARESAVPTQFPETDENQ